ncbi:alkylglycerol monooxygenase-like [Oppia nitens]|uniref:alkylglycerol monooxygenase-like n=1 Tax=Oppia nitens TaxID=1686743 RepID=UPI0023DBA155|nr:alkylglycerol monooxygenase-like [Oppia nitens]
MIEHLIYPNNTSISLTAGQQCARDGAERFVEQLFSLFYILSPSATTYDSPYQVPDYEVALIPAIGLLMILEQIFRFFQHKQFSRFPDFVVNVGSSLIFTLARVFLLTVVINIFIWLYDNYRIVDLPLHSVWTWLLSLLLVEFVYYWTHRALHEFNILWAAHQFHHMAEDINITTTIRDSIVDLVIYDIFPLPLAIIIPPPILVVHIQFSLIYQIWLHNEVVGNLGFIEYVINTPRQHRVHHGKNPYCIDKNYGALIMIWDRLFGTYQSETDPIVFGVVSPTPKTFDPMILQFGYYRDLWSKFCTVQGFGNKMSALFKGPGWAPGKPRLGLISDVPEPDRSLPKYSYDPYIPFWKLVYIGFHGSFLVLGFFLLADHPYVRYSPMKGFIGMLYIIFILTSFGAIFDNRKYAPLLEICRCLTYLPFDYYLIATVHWSIGPNEQLLLAITLWMARLMHVLSVVFWLIYQLVLCTAIGNNRSSSSSANNHEYVMAAKVDKDVESDTSSMMARNRCLTIFILFTILLGVIVFLTAWLSRLESCTQMLNEWKFS